MSQQSKKVLVFGVIEPRRRGAAVSLMNAEVGTHMLGRTTKTALAAAFKQFSLVTGLPYEEPRQPTEA